MSKRQNHRGRQQAQQEKSLLTKLFGWFIAACLWAGLIVALIIMWYAKDLSKITQSAKFDKRPSIIVLANDGSLIARYGDQKGASLTIDDIPEHMVQALLSVEDRRFYYHFGIDPLGLMRAVVVNMRDGRVAQGGSTITQQLAKNLFLTQERTLQRKIQEAILAIWLEWQLSKDEIIAAYLNRVYMGAGAYGIDAASKVYFNKSAKDLTVHESAMLAGLLKAPSRYSPRSNPKAARERAAVVLSLMQENGYLDKNYKVKDTEKEIEGAAETATAIMSGQYFSDWIVEGLDELITLPNEDIIIKTTLDPDVQQAAGRVIARQLEEMGEKNRVSQGAAVVLRPDGSVIAMVGGRDYSKSQFNRATQALRSPGSSFKPIVYLTALERGYGPNSVVYDAPITLNGYTPQNFGNEYYGEVTLYEALTLSLNTVAVQVGYTVGMDRVIGAARRMGIKAKMNPELSLTLGSYGIPMIEMAGAYAVMANGGYATEPYGILEIRNEHDKVLYSRKTPDVPRVFPGAAIADLHSMLRSVVVNGTGRAAQGPFNAMGKTGTSQEHRDVWFSGFTDDYVGSVWYGNDNNSPTRGMTGGSAPARTWREIMIAATQDKSPAPYKAPGPVGGISSFGRLLDSLRGANDLPFLFDQPPQAPNRQIERRGDEMYYPITPAEMGDDPVGASRFNE